MMDITKCRTLILRLMDRDGQEEALMPVMTALPADEMLAAIKGAAREYLDTQEGRAVWLENGCRFGYEGFLEHVGNGICERHGFLLSCEDMSVVRDRMDAQFTPTDAEPRPGEAPGGWAGRGGAVYAVTLQDGSPAYVALQDLGLQGRFRHAAWTAWSGEGFYDVKRGRTAWDPDAEPRKDLAGVLEDAVQAALGQKMQSWHATTVRPEDLEPEGRKA